MNGFGSNGYEKDKTWEVSGVFDGRIERKEFLRRTALLAGSLIIAGSFGALAGCGGSTTKVENNATSTETQTQASTTPTNTAGQAQGSSQAKTAAVNCRFYEDGNCKRTGAACTNCIAR